MMRAGVAQWQSPGLPSQSRGFDSHHPLHFFFVHNFKRDFFAGDAPLLNELIILLYFKTIWKEHV